MKRLVGAGFSAVLLLAGCGGSGHGHAGKSVPVDTQTPPSTTPAPLQVIPGMPPVPDPTNIYSQITPTDLQARFAANPRRVFVPNGNENTVSVIDADTKQVIGKFRTSREPQHVVPSYDLTSIWVLDNQGNDLVPVDPVTGVPGAKLPVDDPYNLYFTPDGQHAVVVAEKHRRLDFYTPDLKTQQFSITADQCKGINHGDWSADGRYALFTCEFNGNVVKIDMVDHKVAGYLTVGEMPQDLRAAPNGRTFYVADMMANGVHIIDGVTLQKTGFLATGPGAHGLTIARDAKRIYVANRGSDALPGKSKRKSPGSLSILDVATNTITKTIPVPGGGSPDMGNLDISGNELWLSGRFDDAVYVYNVTPGQESFLTSIAVGSGPHGLAYMPQPGRYSLGHTGNTR